MALDSATNFVRQTVGSSVGTSDPETIDVSDASAFADPSVSQYDIVIWDAGTHTRPDQDSSVEIMTVTGRDTGNNTLTCARGQQGTSNTSHPSSSDVIVTPLAETDVKDLDAQTVTTEEADITNETFIRATRSSATSSTTSGTMINAFDGESKDVRGEFNSSAQFVPDETGEYLIVATINFEGSTAKSDLVRARIWNDTDSTRVNRQRELAPGAVSAITFVFVDELAAGKNYEVQGTNNDSSFTIATSRTNGEIIRSVVS